MLSEVIGRSFTNEGSTWAHRYIRSKLTRFCIQGLFELTEVLDQCEELK